MPGNNLGLINKCGFYEVLASSSQRREALASFMQSRSEALNYARSSSQHATLQEQKPRTAHKPLTKASSSPEHCQQA